MAAQALTYYQRYKADRGWFRYLVLYLVIMETVNWICDIGVIYEPLIIRYATPEALLISPVMLRTDAVLTVLVSTPIQLFIAWRVRVVTNSFFLPSIITILATVSLGGGLATTAVDTLHPQFADFQEFHLEVIIWLVASAACDVFLTASLVYSLWSRKTNIVSTDSYLNKIIRLSVQTGSITSAAALLDMILYITTNNTSNFVLDFPLSKLYTNALISTLNARPWQEQLLHHDAPNALFEQTPVGQTNRISLVQRQSAYYSQNPLGNVNASSYMGPRRPAKSTLDIGQTP